MTTKNKLRETVEFELTIKMKFNSEWSDYHDEHPDVILCDSGIDELIKNGISYELVNDSRGIKFD